jgi:peptidoglycan-N-acetylglucosamine deacetylase
VAPLDLTLTFDNGPEPETTLFVLDVLARRSIRTTFFMVGNKLSTPEGRELARRAHEEGHWIGNHTWSHSTPLGLLKDPSAIGTEIRDTQEAIGALRHCPKSNRLLSHWQLRADSGHMDT